MVARQNLEICVRAVQVIQYPAIPAAAARPRKAWVRADEVLRYRLPGGPVHRVPRGGEHLAPRRALVPGLHGAASPAARHYLPGPAGGPRRRRGGGLEVPPEPVGYAAVAAGGKQQQLTKLNFAVTGFGNC